MKVKILKAGLQTTVQDFGRTHQQYGVPVGGVMDRKSMQLANNLVGNPQKTPVLEITLMGPTLKFDEECQIAITGANLSPHLNQKPIEINETILVNSNDELSFNKPILGCRSYLAIGGTWNERKWLNSYSSLTFTKEGMRLNIGVELNITPSKLSEMHVATKEQIPDFTNNNSVRVLPGPEYDLFSAKFKKEFFSQSFKITPQSNRMGYRLEANLPKENLASGIISSGIVPGTIQILPSSNPVILLADAQTTGGYPRFANVISSDLNLLAQKKPGDVFSFISF